MFESINGNYVSCDPTNASNHNTVVLNLKLYYECTLYDCEQAKHTEKNSMWHKATDDSIRRYSIMLDNELSKIELPDGLVTCNNIKCNNDLDMSLRSTHIAMRL